VAATPLDDHPVAARLLLAVPLGTIIIKIIAAGGIEPCGASANIKLWFGANATTLASIRSRKAFGLP
jgi:hypothetical protein